MRSCGWCRCSLIVIGILSLIVIVILIGILILVVLPLPRPPPHARAERVRARGRARRRERCVEEKVGRLGEFRAFNVLRARRAAAGVVRRCWSDDIMHMVVVLVVVLVVKVIVELHMVLAKDGRKAKGEMHKMFSSSM